MKEDSLWIEGDDPLHDVQPTISSTGDAGFRHIGCPLSWFKLVFPVVRGKNELAVALWLYRLRSIRRSRTITVSNGPLAELGIDRFAKYRTLRRLAKAGLISIKNDNRKATRIRFCK